MQQRLLHGHGWPATLCRVPKHKIDVGDPSSDPSSSALNHKYDDCGLDGLLLWLDRPDADDEGEDDTDEEDKETDEEEDDDDAMGVLAFLRLSLGSMVRMKPPDLGFLVELVLLGLYK